MRGVFSAQSEPCCNARKHVIMLCHVQSAGLVDRIIREHADDILDSDKAVRRVEAERHSQLASARVRSCCITPFLHCLYLSTAFPSSFKSSWES